MTPQPEGKESSGAIQLRDAGRDSEAVVPPNSESVIAISREAGVSTATIHYWRKQAAEGMLETFRKAESQIVKDDVKTEVAKGFSPVASTRSASVAWPSRWF